MAVAGGLPWIRSPHATLRELDESDAVPLAAVLSDSEVRQHLAPPPSNADAFAHFIEWAQARRRAAECCCFAVVPNDSKLAAGLFQLRRLNTSGDLAEWGFLLARPYWGTGLFLECAREILKFGFDSLAISRLEATVPLANIRAHAVMRKMGAVQTGFLTNRTASDAPVVEGAVWSLTPWDWREASSRRPPR